MINGISQRCFTDLPSVCPPHQLRLLSLPLCLPLPPQCRFADLSPLSTSHKLCNSHSPLLLTQHQTRTRTRATRPGTTMTTRATRPGTTMTMRAMRPGTAMTTRVTSLPKCRNGRKSHLQMYPHTLKHTTASFLLCTHVILWMWMITSTLQCPELCRQWTDRSFV